MYRSLNLRNLLKLLLLTGVAGASIGHARDFTVASWGGGLQDAQRQAFIKPFETKYGVKTTEDVYLGGWAKFQTMADTKQIVWDVVNVESAEMARGCEEGVFAKLDYAKVGVPKSDFVPGAADECGIGAYTFAFVVAYNEDLTKVAPKTMLDFWDTQKWPGRRGLRKGAHYNLEFALLSDGVGAADVYKVLSTKEGVARAFRKLSTIKSQVIWWEAPAQVADLLASGNVVMSIAPNARISDARKSGKNLGMVFQPGMIGIDYWVVLSGSPFQAQAYDFLKIVSDPKQQERFTAAFAYAPTNRKTEALLDPKVAALLPIGSKVANALLTSSIEANRFWSDHGDEINIEWNNWLAR
jgi:putative spermidine/putrescine transport system substrate-binding protein